MKKPFLVILSLTIIVGISYWLLEMKQFANGVIDDSKHLDKQKFDETFEIGTYLVDSIESLDFLDNILDKLNKPTLHRAFNNRLFIKGATTENIIEIWEIEFELQRLMQVDLDTIDINFSNQIGSFSEKRLLK